MRSALKVLFVVAFAIPTVASAAITTTKHNLTTSGPGSAKFSDAADQCQFCHLVHDANTAKRALWARADSVSTKAAFTAFTNTVAGTTLPATYAALGDGSKQCLSCHDGTVAVNTVMKGGTAAYQVAVTTASSLLSLSGTNEYRLNNTSTAYLANLDGQHPVGIPYPGSTVNTVTSQAVAGEYGVPLTTGCAAGISTCVTSAIVGAGTAVKLYGDAGAYSVECGSCHEPHKADTGGNFLNFLRVSAATTNGRCGACHIK